MASAHYRKKYDDCPICSCNEFEAGFIDKRLKEAHWPEGVRHPDFEAMGQELSDRFGIEVAADKIKEHWDLHVSLRLAGYRAWARKVTKHSPAKDPYGAGMMGPKGRNRR